MGGTARPDCLTFATVELQDRTSACPRAARNGGGGAPGVIGAAEPLQCVDAVSSVVSWMGEGCTVEVFVGNEFFDGLPT